MKGVYLVTDGQSLGGRALAAVVEAAVDGGVSCVQLREKHLNTRDFIAQAQAIRPLLRDRGIPLLINDRLDVALAVEADGVHIGQQDMPYPLARKLLGPQAIIGLSVESLDEVYEAEHYDVDYLGVSAIFATPVKTDTRHLWGLDGLRQVRHLSRHPLVAIGGIDQSNAAQVVAAGADSIAVVSAICAATDPQQATANLARVFA